MTKFYLRMDQKLAIQITIILSTLYSRIYHIEISKTFSTAAKLLVQILAIQITRVRIFSHIQPFYERAVSNLDT